MRETTLAVQRMQDYIADHLDEPITLSDLSAVSLFSPWYSYRLFRDCLGLTPAEYVRRLRLSRSALRLRQEGCRVTDAALDLGFGSVDGYARAFRKEFGLKPSQYARRPVPVALFVPYGAKFRELRKDVSSVKEVQSVFVQPVHKPARRAVIKRGVQAEEYFAYCQEVGCDVWGTLLSMDSLCGEPVCLWLPESMRRAGTSRYVQGVETAAEGEAPVPEGFEIIALPEADYLMFQGEPFREEDYCEAIAAVQQAMEKYDPAVLGLVWDDSQPRIQLEPRGSRGYIELRAVKNR